MLKFEQRINMLESFHNDIDQIELTRFPVSKREEMLYELADLYRFIDNDSESIKIVESHRDRMKIINVHGSNVGVFFIGEDKFFSGKLNLPTFSNLLKREVRKNITEFWLVFVSTQSLNKSVVKDFISNKSLNFLYNKIFLFDFFRSEKYEIA